MATTFDALLACIFPLALCFVGYRLRDNFCSLADLRHLLFPTSSPPSSTAALFSLERAYNAYLQYESLSKGEISTMKASYGKLGRSHKKLGSKIGYTKKLERLWDTTGLNGMLAADIAERAVLDHPTLQDQPRLTSSFSDLARVREAMKHYIRDWSEDGLRERTAIFSPILNLLATVDPQERRSQKILVPGAGLCRLAWEISQLGFDTSANELSYYMILAFRLLVSTDTVNEHKLRPYAHWWSHQRDSESLFRAVSFPDSLPRLGPNFRLIEGDFLKIDPPAVSADEFWKDNSSRLPSNGEGYDYVVTLFFIDTSTNVFETMEQIYRLLRPGGTWVNLGPLLWTGGGHASLELSLTEVLQAAHEIGFDVQQNHEDPGHPEARRTVECEYTADADAMMQWTYKAEYWVARKPAAST